MAGRSISSANAVMTLSVGLLFPSPVTLKGWASDEFYAVGRVVTTETAMGIDGILSGGFVFNPIEQTFSLQADSVSVGMFEQWYRNQVLIKDVYIAQGVLQLPSLGRKWILANGFLVDLDVIPDAGKVLKMRKYTVRWEAVYPQPIGA